MKLTKPLKNGWNLGSVAHVESNAHTHPKDICAYKNHLHIYPCVLRTASGPHVIQYIYIYCIYTYIKVSLQIITCNFLKYNYDYFDFDQICLALYVHPL